MPTYQIERRKRGFFGWIFLVAFWLFNAFMAFALFAGLSNVSNMSSTLTSDAERAGAAIGTTIGASMILGIWLAGAVILGLFVLFTRGTKIIETIEKP